MITGVRLTGFRGHEDLALSDLRMVSLVVGRNNAGKSSVLQALSWPRYGIRILQGLNPNTELFHKGGSAATIRIEYNAGFGRPTAPDLVASYSFSSRANELPAVVETGPGRALSDGVFYLSTHREAQGAYAFLPYQNDVGIDPELPWQVYREMRDVREEDYERIAKWGAQIIGGVSRIRSPSANARQGTTTAHSHGYVVRLLAQGAGIGAALPIVIQGVICTPGQTLVIDEGELHLHRDSIDTLVAFFADCAKRGVQIICSTQSVDLVAAVNDAAFVNEVGDDSGPPPGTFSMHEIRVDANGKTDAVRHNPAKDVDFNKVRLNLARSVGI